MRRILFSAAAFLLLLLAHSCSGNYYILEVDVVNGQDDPDTCQVDQGTFINSTVPCKSLQFALAGVQANDIVEVTVYPGVYAYADNGNLVLNQQSFTITGVLDADGNPPIVDCEDVGTGATITPKTTAKISTMGWRRCKGANGGALNVQVSQGTTNQLELDNCVFDSNVATSTGGAIYSESHVVTVSSSIFYNNTASTTGGAISMRNNAISVQLSNFTNNFAPQGAAIYGYNLQSLAPLIFSYCNFTDNTATTQGGAFFAEAPTNGQFIDYSFTQSIIDNNCATSPYTDSYDVQVKCTPTSSCNITDRGIVSGCLNVYKPPTVNETGGGKHSNNKDKDIIIGVVVPFGVIFIVSISLFLYLRNRTNVEMDKREEYRKTILKALDRMSPEEQEAARLEAERADPSAPKCQLCMIRPINNPLPCGHAVVCSVCRTILLECPIKGCKKPTR